MPKKITFSGARLLAFSRSAKKGGVAKFSAIINDHVLKNMEWSPVDEHLTSCAPEGDLQASLCELIPKDKKLQKFALDLQTQRVHNFEIIRKEIEGKRGKGYRHELFFDVRFGDPAGCRKLEDFMLNAGSAKCGLVVSYEPKAEQADLELPNATEEQRQAVMDVQ